jgi:hypothetical protein
MAVMCLLVRRTGLPVPVEANRITTRYVPVEANRITARWQVNLVEISCWREERFELKVLRLNLSVGSNKKPRKSVCAIRYRCCI